MHVPEWLPTAAPPTALQNVCSLLWAKFELEKNCLTDETRAVSF